MLDMGTRGAGLQTPRAWLSVNTMSRCTVHVKAGSL